MERKNENLLTMTQAEILLATCIFARSTAFVVLKTCLESVSPFMLMALRSLIAFAFVAVIFRKKLTNLSAITIKRGFILGVLFSGLMITELYGLQGTATTLTALIENSALVWIPICECFLKKKLPTPILIVCDLVAIAGIFMMTFDGAMEVSFNTIFVVIATVFYTVCIIVTDRFSRKDDPIVLGILQVGFMGVIGLIVSLVFGLATLPDSGMTWLFILFLAIVCSGFGFTLQPLAQSRVPSEKASLFIAISPLSATLLGVLILHERFSLMGFFGAVLVLISIFIAIVATHRN